MFGSNFCVLNDKEHLGKFNPKSIDEEVIGYSKNSQAYRIYNMQTQTIIEHINAKIDDTDDFTSYL